METRAKIALIIEQHQNLPGALLPILHAIQEACSHIPPDAVPAIAQALHLSRAEVHGVIAYYAHFRLTPPGSHIVRVCCAEACQSVGGEALAEHARRCLTTSKILLEPVYCLGLCACGPALQVDDTTLHALVTPEKFDAVIAALEDAL